MGNATMTKLFEYKFYHNDHKMSTDYDHNPNNDENHHFQHYHRNEGTINTIITGGTNVWGGCKTLEHLVTTKGENFYKIDKHSIK